MRNTLSQESSLYLQQHANNPVWWQPWGELAWQKARDENKPVIISIGYSSCHWCHVMEHHCFEDKEVAEVMNAHFICIKVDREERPDVDAVYMDALHMMGLQGGWPLNVIATPDGAPFYGGTYFPKAQWIHLLNQVAKAYAETPEELSNAGEGFRKALQGSASATASVANNEVDWKRAIEKIKRQFDGDRGGVGQAPKFPMPNLYQFLLSHAFVENDDTLKQQVIGTLNAMAFGGIYDHIGGGFCRYSTDADWHVPHFEKMLYDNGQLLSLYAKAYQLDSNLLYRDICLSIIEFLGREMKADNGAFYASIDADSEGIEGKFYAWTKNDFDAVVGAKLSEYLAPFYDVTEEGNWEHGVNVLSRNQSEEAFAASHNMGESQFHRLVIEGRSKLFDARSQRIKPVTDRKVLTCWNALTINGLTDVYRYTDNASALQMAIEATEYIMDHGFYEGRLQRLPGSAGKAPAYLDDYAALALACLNLFQATFQQKYAEYAIRLVDTALATFADTEGDTFFFLDTGADPNLISRYKEKYDNVVPSSNSMLCHALLILHHITLEERYEQIAHRMLAQAIPMLTEALRHASNWAHCQYLASPELVYFQIVGPDALAYRLKIDQMGLPFYLISGALSFSNLRSISDKKPPQKKTGIWLCRNSACLPPVYRVEDLELD